MSQQRPEDPTPDQIAERAKLIRDGWSDAEHYQRATGRSVPPEWTVPRAKISGGAAEPAAGGGTNGFH